MVLGLCNLPWLRRASPSATRGQSGRADTRLGLARSGAEGYTGRACERTRRQDHYGWGFGPMAGNVVFRDFRSIHEGGLKPKGDPVPHPEAFYHGLRLCGVDGSLFSVTNAPQAKRQMRKARSRRGRAAFPKVGVAVMVELGLHIETLSTSSDVRLGQVQIACWLEKPPSLSQPGLGARVAKIMEMLGG